MLIRRKLSFEKAIEIAKSHYPQYTLNHAWDLKKEWLFCYDFGSLDLMGPRNILVNKRNGSVTYFHLPEYKGVKPSDKNMIF